MSRGLIILCLLIVTDTSFAQLTGAVRKDFIDGAAQVCFKTQRAGSPNANLPDATLRKYCKCAMTYQADLLNNQLAKDIENGLQKPNPVWGEMAQKYCQIHYTEY